MNNDITQWEYKRIDFLRSQGADFDTKMNQLGEQGWEAAGTISAPGYENTVLLKRPKQAQPDYNYSR